MKNCANPTPGAPAGAVAPSRGHRISRRQMLGRSAGFAAVGALGLASPARVRAATRGRIRQSIVHWCFEPHWDIETMCRIAKQLGCPSIELVGPAHYEVLRKHGLECAIVQIDLNPDPPFIKGWNNPLYFPKVMKATRDAIDAAARCGAPNVIAFTGFSAHDVDDPTKGQMSPEAGAENCVRGLKQIMSYAEQKRVNLCLEVLNTRDDSDPMKGHPGYQGNHTEYCVDIIRRVGSERMKLLFDIYHIQVMDGDLIRRLRQYRDLIGHVHVAGNPGRGELDPDQEIQFPALMRALLDIGYTGYVGQEYIPTRDPLAGLTEAVALCDV